MPLGFTATIPQGQGCLQFTTMVTVDASTVTDAAWVTVSTGFSKPVRILKIVSTAGDAVLVRYTDTGNAQDVIAETTGPQYLNIQTNHDAVAESGGENCKMRANQLIQLRAPTGVTLSGAIYIVAYA